MVEFLGIMTFMIPPSVSTPIDNGATSSNKSSAVFAPPVSLKIAA